MNEYMRMADRMYDLENQMKQLEKENAKLKEQLYAFDEEREKKLNENIDLKKQNKTKEPALNYIAQLEAENRKLNAYNAKLLQSDIDKQNKICLLSAKIQKLEKILVNHPELKEE